MEKTLPKHKGVQFDKRRNTWFVVIKLNGKVKYLGSYFNFDDAVNKRLEAEKIYQLPIKTKRKEFENNIIKYYLDGNSLIKVGKKFNRNATSILEILQKNNIIRRNNENNVNVKLIIEQYSNGSTIQNIAAKMKVSHNCIRKRLLDHNVKIRPNRKYFFDETIFEKIDCEWKAYYLGLFCADAGLTRLNIKLSLHEKDKELITKLNNIVYNGKFKLTYTPFKIYKQKNGKIYRNNPQYGIYINSKKIVHDLIKLGCGLKKSLTLTFPSYKTIPQNLFNHFIRGYFDGDGCIQLNNFQIISSNDFCFGLQKWLIIELNMPSHLKKCNKVSRLFIHRRKDIKVIYHYLYDNATIYLKRKYNKFKELDYSI